MSSKLHGNTLYFELDFLISAFTHKFTNRNTSAYAFCVYSTVRPLAIVQKHTQM